MKRIGLKINKYNIYLYYRAFYKYKSFFLVPAITLEAYNKTLDLELKFISFGVGIRAYYISNNT